MQGQVSAEAILLVHPSLACKQPWHLFAHLAELPADLRCRFQSLVQVSPRVVSCEVMNLQVRRCGRGISYMPRVIRLLEPLEKQSNPLRRACLHAPRTCALPAMPSPSHGGIPAPRLGPQGGCRLIMLQVKKAAAPTQKSSLGSLVVESKCILGRPSKPA